MNEQVGIPSRMGVGTEEPSALCGPKLVLAEAIAHGAMFPGRTWEKAGKIEQGSRKQAFHGLAWRSDLEICGALISYRLPAPLGNGGKSSSGLLVNPVCVCLV